MKKFLLISLILLIMPVVLSAGQTQKIDISNIPQQSITINEKDRFEFSFLGGTHTVIVNNINEKGAELDLFPYINLKDKPPVSYSTANYENIIYFDVNKDLIKDISIKLTNMGKDYETATLLITNVNLDENVNGTIIPNKLINKPRVYNYNIILIILGIAIAIVISLIIYFISKK